MKKKNIVLTILLILTMVLVACGKPSPETPSVEPPQTPTETPSVPSLPTETSTSGPWLTTYLPVPREINQINYTQIIESMSVIYSILPTETSNFTDQYGNNYEVAYWNEKQTSKITATIETIISRKVGIDQVNTSDPYPVPTNLIPNEVKLYLEPSPQIQSGNPIIKAQTQTIGQNFVKEADVVNNTFTWISQNIKWGCPSDIEGYAADAVWTLEHKEGNCVNFANLTIALLRAQGIPARYALGFKGYEDSNPGYLKPAKGSDWHVWTEVYYPQVGWVRYDATYFPHPWHITYGIQIKVMPDGTKEDYGGWRGQARGEASENWQLTGSKDNKVKLTYTITFFVKE